MLKFIVHQNGCAKNYRDAVWEFCCPVLVRSTMCQYVPKHRCEILHDGSGNRNKFWNVKHLWVHLCNKAQGPGGSRLVNTTPQDIETIQNSTTSAVPKIYPCDSGSRPTRATQPAKMKSNSSVEGLFESLSGYCLTKNVRSTWLFAALRWSVTTSHFNTFHTEQFI